MSTLISVLFGAAFSSTMLAQSGVVAVEATMVLRSEGWSTATLVEADSRGNAVVVGMASAPVNLYSDVGSIELTDVDSQSSVVASIRPDGMPEWALVARAAEEGSGTLRFGDMRISGDDTIFLAGLVSGQVVVDGPTEDVERFGSQAIFVMSLSASGDILDVREFPLAPTYGDAVVTSLALDTFGGLLLGGWSNRDIDFAPGSPSGQFIPVGRDGFVARFDQLWQLSWLTQITGDADVQDIALGPQGNVLLAGSSRGLGVVLGSNGSSEPLTSSVSAPFVAQLDATGVVSWVSQSVGGGSAESVALVPRAEGVALLGTFNQTLSFKNADEQVISVRGFGARDVFLAEIDGSGVWSALTVMGGEGVDLAGDIVRDADGNIFLVGTGYGTIRIRGPKASSFMERERGQGAFALSFAPDFSLRWSVRDYSGISMADGVALAADSSVLVSGAIAGHIRFATGLPAASSQSPQIPNGFALRIAQSNAPVAPGPVLKLGAKRQSDRIVVTWNPPAADGGSRVIGYDVRINGGPWKMTYKTSQTFPLPRRGVRASVDVRAVNGVGPGLTSTVNVRLRGPSRGGPMWEFPLATDTAELGVRP